MAFSEVLDDFENGDVSGWNTNEGWNTTTSHSYNGSRSAHANFQSGTYTVARRGFGEEVKSVEVWYQCTSNGWGDGYELVDSNGNQVTAAGNINPDWRYVDGSSESGASGGSYDTWTSIRFELDYDNGTVDITFNESGGGSDSVTASLRNNNPVTEIRVVNLNRSGDLADRSPTDDAQYEAYTDYITYEPETSPPSSPRNLSATVDANDQITLSWNAPSDWGGEQGNYRVYRGTSSGSYSAIDTTGSTTYTDTNLSSDTNYYYVVTAYNSAGESGYSNEDSGETHDVPYAVQNCVVTVNSASEITTTWDPPTDWNGNQGGYDVYRGTESGSLSYIDSVGSGTLTFTDGDLLNGEKYFYHIVAYNIYGDGPPSNEDSGITNLPIPTNIDANPTL